MSQFDSLEQQTTSPHTLAKGWERCSTPYFNFTMDVYLTHRKTTTATTKTTTKKMMTTMTMVVILPVRLKGTLLLENKKIVKEHMETSNGMKAYMLVSLSYTSAIPQTMRFSFLIRRTRTLRNYVIYLLCQLVDLNLNLFSFYGIILFRWSSAPHRTAAHCIKPDSNVESSRSQFTRIKMQVYLQYNKQKCTDKKWTGVFKFGIYFKFYWSRRYS